MGNSAAGILTATFFGTAATVLGAAGGAQSSTLTTPNLPAYTPHGTNIAGWDGTINTFQNGTGATFVAPDANHMTHGANLDPQGGVSTAFNNVSPELLVTIYMKL